MYLFFLVTFRIRRNWDTTILNADQKTLANGLVHTFFLPFSQFHLYTSLNTVEVKINNKKN